MTTYVYETIPQAPGKKPRRFEVRQSMKAPALTKHPETGEPVKRVLMGGYGVMTSRRTSEPAPRPTSCCGGGACHCH